jgi:hypothetical protein
MQNVSIKSGVFRICVGLLLLIGAGLAGFWLRSPVIVFWLGFAFTLSYASGRVAAWKSAWQRGMRGALLPGLLLTYLVQTVWTGLLYLLGLGIAALFKPVALASALTQQDFAHISALVSIGVVSGIVLYFMEGASPASMFKMAGDDAGLAEQSGAKAIDSDVVSLLDESVTPSTMFSSIHYSHADNTAPENDRYLPNQKSAGSDEKIAAAESRLKIALPESLRAIYRHQNGGHLREICAPRGITSSTPMSWDDLISPFSGYSDLIPLENLRFLYEHIEAYAFPDTEAERFPAGCQKMLVLARWYEHTLFLDYNACFENNQSEPGVAFVDFEHEHWQEHVVRWKNFSEFFSSLRFVKS